MIIALSAGHNVYNNGYFDSGSIGNGLKEADITKETVKLLKIKLEALGHKVIDITPYNEHFKDGNFYGSNAIAKKNAHFERAKRVNALNVDLYMDVHVNAGGGSGPEVWVYSNKSNSYNIAENICNNISKATSLPNRGIKINPGYWSLSMVKAPAMIIEGGFIDTKKDMERLTPEVYSDAIANSFNNINKDKPIINKEDDKPSSWAQDSWTWATDEGLLDGKRPKDNLTRQEFAVVLKRILDKKKE